MIATYENNLHGVVSMDKFVQKRSTTTASTARNLRDLIAEAKAGDIIETDEDLDADGDVDDGDTGDNPDDLETDDVSGHSEETDGIGFEDLLD